MKQTIYQLYRNLTYNIKTLLLFEVFYHLLGFLIIFPLARFLLLYSIKVSGHAYITNQLIISYLINPATIFVIVVLVTILSIYLVIEVIFLAIIYDFGYHEEAIDLKDLMILGFKRSIRTIKKYHIIIIFLSFLLLFIVHLIHFTGVFSTLVFPEQIVDQIIRLTFLKWGLIFISALFVILFFETGFHMNLYVIDQLSIKDTFHQNQKMLKKQRFRMIFEFIILNVVLSVIFYVIYFLVLALIALFIFITRDQSYILSVLLTFMYSIYAVTGLIASTFLIPINFALLSTWYYERKERLGIVTKAIRVTQKERNAFNFKIMKRATFVALVILFAFNISNIVSITREERVPIEIFKYAEIVAHRGASWDAPENTLAALNLAIEQSSDAVEFDVRETIDQHPVLMHDETTGRTTNDILDRRVSSLTLDEIKSLDAGSWFSNAYIGEPIPTLEEAFELISKKTRAFVELKDISPTLEDNTVKVIERYNMVNDTVVLSFNLAQLRRINQLNEEIKTLLLIPVFYGDIDQILSYSDIDYYGFSRDIIAQNPHFVNLAQQKEKLVYVWTVNTEQNLRNAVSNDVDGIISDRPVLAREIAYTKNTSTVFQDFLRRVFNRNI